MYFYLKLNFFVIMVFIYSEIFGFTVHFQFKKRMFGWMNGNGKFNPCLQQSNVIFLLM